MVRPFPLGPLGVEGGQQSALEEAFGAVPPPHVSEAEALLDTGIQTMEVRCVRAPAGDDAFMKGTRDWGGGGGTEWKGEGSSLCLVVIYSGCKSRISFGVKKLYWPYAVDSLNNCAKVFTDMP